MALSHPEARHSLHPLAAESQAMSSDPTTTPARTWVPLPHRERRVAGVLIEKQKTTPEYYPMTVAAIVTGSNQKSNRDPVTNFDADDVEDILNKLRAKGAVVIYESTGRVPKWKHTLYDWFGLKNRPADLAVLAELLLRGPQTEGELRTRASRMDSIPDLDALQDILNRLEAQGLVIFLSPPGQKRGVVVTHGLYPPDELERVRATFTQKAQATTDEDEPPSRGGSKLDDLRTELATLRTEVEILRAEVRDLKASLGA
jgi:uncharacterized protein YceH (UPF0502 family)